MKLMKIRLMVLAGAAVAMLATSAPSASADPISLFSTGVDATGTPLANGAVDPHYTVNGVDAYAIGCPGCIGWVGNTATAQWISADPSTVRRPWPVYLPDDLRSDRLRLPHGHDHRADGGGR